MRQKLMLIVLALVALAASAALAATDNDSHTVTITVNEVAMIRVNGANDVSFTIGAPTTDGDAFLVTPANADAKWLQYTSIVPTDSTYKRTIQVDLASGSGSIPAGTTLNVMPSAPAGVGKGNRGNQVGSAVAISGTAADVVTDVRSCYTGMAATGGVQLTYSLEINNGEEGLLYSPTSAYTPVVRYTLTSAE